MLVFGAGTTKPSSGSSLLPLLLLLGVVFYFLIYRPQQKKQKAAREASNSFEVGDEVVTAGGIVGRVLDIDGDRVTLETGVGHSFEVLRPYVLRKLEPTPAPTEPAASDASDASDDSPNALGSTSDALPQPQDQPEVVDAEVVEDDDDTSGSATPPGS